MGWLVRWKCLVACLPGDWSQRPKHPLFRPESALLSIRFCFEFPEGESAFRSCCRNGP